VFLLFFRASELNHASFRNSQLHGLPQRNYDIITILPVIVCTTFDRLIIFASAWLTSILSTVAPYSPLFGVYFDVVAFGELRVVNFLNRFLVTFSVLLFNRVGWIEDTLPTSLAFVNFVSGVLFLTLGWLGTQKYELKFGGRTITSTNTIVSFVIVLRSFYVIVWAYSIYNERIANELINIKSQDYSPCFAWNVTLFDLLSNTTLSKQRNQPVLVQRLSNFDSYEFICTVCPLAWFVALTFFCISVAQLFVAYDIIGFESYFDQVGNFKLKQCRNVRVPPKDSYPNEFSPSDLLYGLAFIILAFDSSATAKDSVGASGALTSITN